MTGRPQILGIGIGLLFGALVAMGVLLALVPLASEAGPTLFAVVFLVAVASSVLVVCLQLRLMEVAADAKMLGAALNHSALNVANALAATAAALAQEVPPETIRSALRGFANSFAQTPGRFNLLAIEGRKYNIRIWTLAPGALTRMTADLFPEAAFEAFAPEKVAPAALFLVSEDAPSGVIVGAGAGVFQSSYVTLTPGALLQGDDLSPEGVAAHWDEITDRAGEIVPKSGAEQAMLIGRKLQG